MTTWIEQLADQVRRIDEMEAYVPHLVVQARYAGASWQELGEALGVSRQAAHEKYAPIIAGRREPAPAGFTDVPLFSD
jgi:hypothetical protein